MRQALTAGLPAMGLALTDQQVQQLCTYGQLLIEKNQVMNLTAITEPAEVARLHFLDCLALLGLADFAGKTVIDVGCGAGFPGLPLKLAQPSMDLTLLDSLAKRMDWLREIVPQLDTEAEVVTARAEELAFQRRERYDIAVSRAVARLNILCELCLPYVKVGGVFLAMKGEMAEAEAQEAQNAIGRLGGQLERVAAYEIPGAGVTHRAVVIRKVSPTPTGYPRRYAKIKQNPL
jgi:16S rRNA (guanine527-N7)-methyltransferase